MNVLLINPIIRGEETPSYFPLGLGYIAQVLLNKGHDVNILDINAYRLSQEEVEKRIRNISYDVVGITGLITEYNYIKWLISVLKDFNQEAKVILGGGLASASPKLLLEKIGADIVVIGEGEVTINEVIHGLENTRDLKLVKGIWFKEKDTIHQTVAREPIKSIDDIPFPNRDLFPMEIYIEGMKERWFFDMPIRATNMITSRGCPYNCIYCDHGVWGKKFRARSAENIVDEIKLLIKKYDIQGVVFNDDTFVLDKKRIYSFCKLLKNQKIKISWACNGRVNLMDQNLLKEMKSAGCKTIAYGIESGSQTILNEMNKQVTVDQAKKAIKLTRDVGITPIAYLMIGLFSETEKTIKETVNFCKETGIRGSFNFVTPIPGTVLYQKAKEMGKIYHTEEELLKEWDVWQHKIIVNLTSMTDEKLMNLKKEAEAQINEITLSVIWSYYKKYGFRKLVKRFYQKYFQDLGG